MQDCVFCRIASGTIPSHKVYESDNFIAFLDTHPRNPGHVQVIPREHYRWVWDVPNIGEYFETVSKIAHAIKRAMKTEWVVSAVIGEEVSHAHVWLVPRYPNDGHGAALDFGNIKKVSEAEMKEIANKISRNIR